MRVSPLGSKCFNSRTPGGVRHFHVIIGRYLDSVSIHAPREGCDPNLAKAPVILLMFQFTHPGRGATLAYIFDSALSERFNSRTPGGVRLLVNPFRLLAYQFQFTHPGRGATISKSLPTPRLSVSIHAPREGCDLSEDSLISSEQSFNSRTPGGVRRTRSIALSSSLMFQFTHPGRGATVKQTQSFASWRFQFTHPGRGATVIIVVLFIPSRFQFTHPGRGATY